MCMEKKPDLPVHFHILDSLSTHRRVGQSVIWIGESQELCCLAEIQTSPASFAHLLKVKKCSVITHHTFKAM